MKHFSTLGRLALAVGLLGVCALASPPARTADPTPPATKLVTIEGITEYRLDNGLRILLFPDPSTSTITVNLTVLVGSRHEGYGETGMAHLLEHLLFKGTPRYPNIPQALRDHGAAFNGTTWVDRTNYFETLPATDANLEFGIRLEADRLVNSFVKREDLLSEMTVVRNEFEMGENNPQGVLSQRMMAAAYEWHNYGKDTIGNRSDIERVPIERLQAFYRKYYQPDNAVLVVAGKFDEAKALALIHQHFGPLQRPGRPPETTYTEEPAQDGERTVVLRRVGKVGVVGAVYHIPAAAHEDFAAVQVLNQVLVAEPSGRLYRALVEGKKATSVRGSAYGWHDPGVLEFLVQTEPAKLEAARDTLLDVLERLAAEPVTAEEVERARRKLARDRELLMAQSNRVATELSEWVAKGDWRLFFLHRDRVARVTPADVTRVAGRYLQRTNRTVGLYIPSEQAQRAAIPAAPPVAELVKDYKGSQALAAGETFDPTPANLDRRAQRSQLPGGLKVALLPKKTRGQTVMAQLTLRYGNDQALKGLTSATQLLGPLLLRGTREYSRQQLQDELDKLGARLSEASGLGELTFTLQAKRDTLPAVLRLLGKVLREPTFPASEFEILKGEYKEALEKGLTEPTALASRALQRRLSPHPADDVRYVPTLEESLARLQAVTLEQVRKLYGEQLGGGHGELAVVGDFDPAATVDLVQTILQDWKAAVAYERIARPANTTVAGGRLEILTPDKANAVYMAGHLIALTDGDPDYPALELANFLFGGSFSARLVNRVRHKEGLSYGVQSLFSADARDPAARFLLFAISNPENTDKVDRAIAEELEKLLTDGVGDEELAAAKKAYFEQLKVQRASDRRLVGLLGERLFEGRTFAHDDALEKQLAALTPAEVRKAVQKHFAPQKLVIVRAGDFHKK
jgi:zinc protease